MNSTLIQTDRFALSETERSAIEHELHHYEDPRAASIEAGTSNSPAIEN